MGKYWDLLTHPMELRAVIQWAVWHDPLHERDRATETPTLKTCYDFLDKTSRSFSMVIQELQPELRVPVTISLFFNLILGNAILFDSARAGHRGGRHDNSY
jgi:farnesyl-diphosphate farnesyltransferase